MVHLTCCHKTGCQLKKTIEIPLSEAFSLAFIRWNISIISHSESHLFQPSSHLLILESLNECGGDMIYYNIDRWTLRLRWATKSQSTEDLMRSKRWKKI